MFLWRSSPSVFSRPNCSIHMDQFQFRAFSFGTRGDRVDIDCWFPTTSTRMLGHVARMDLSIGHHNSSQTFTTACHQVYIGSAPQGRPRHTWLSHIYRKTKAVLSCGHQRPPTLPDYASTMMMFWGLSHERADPYKGPIVWNLMPITIGHLIVLRNLNVKIIDSLLQKY